MSSTIFKQLNFNTKKDFRDSTQETEWGFFVPGVNSGIYDPASLHVRVVIREKKARFFYLRASVSSSHMTLSFQQFDELFSEMQKIKALRDSLAAVRNGGVK